MRLSQSNYKIQQPTFTKTSNKNSDPFPPWHFREFSMRPTVVELGEERDGAFLRRKTVVRFLGRPYAFGEVWKSVQATRTDGSSYWKKKIFRSTKDLPGFQGRDVYQTVIDENLKPLNDKKRSGEKVTSEEWKEAFQTTPLYETKHAFELVDFQWHHFVKDGNRAVLAPHIDRNCPLCKSPDPYTSEKRFGGRKYWAMKKSEFNAFLSEDSRLGAFAVDTDGNVLECHPGTHLVGMQCTNCGHNQITQQNLADATEQQVMQWTDNDHRCDSCGNKGFLKDVLVDGVVRRLSYKDVFWEIEWNANKTTRNGKPSVSNSRVIFTPIIPDRLSELQDAGDFGPLPLEIGDPEWGQTPDMLGTPYDLADCYRPEARSFIDGSKIAPKDFADREDYCQAIFESAAAALGIDNPYRPEGGTEEEFDSIPF